MSVFNNQAGIFAEYGPLLDALGYSALPIMPGTKKPGMRVNGRWFPMRDWPTPRPAEEFIANGCGAGGLGVLAGPASGGMLAVDIDSDHPKVIQALRDALPGTPVSKAGQRGLTLFYHGRGIVSRKWTSGGIVQLLGAGRQTVLPPSMHPDTGSPYIWLGESTLLEMSPNALPEGPADIIERIDAALIPFGYAPLAAAMAGNGHDRDPRADETEHRRINNEALANLPKWVLKLRLYRCRRRGRGYDAVATWRASSSGKADKDRNLNLCVHPDGIRDFGNGDKYTPLDLVKAAPDCDLDEAFAFLADCLGWTDGALFGPEFVSRNTSKQWKEEASNGQAKEQGDKVNDNKGAQAPRATRVVLEDADKITPERTYWLWKGWLAHRKLHLICGPPQAGKSTICFSFAAILSAGGVLPDGTQAEPVNVIIWTSEDGVEDTVIPRLMQMGADLTRIKIVRVRRDHNDKERPFDPARDMPLLLEAAQGLADGVAFLVIDPVVAVIGAKTDSHKNAETRQALQPLKDFAEQANCVVMGVHHFTKGTAGRDPVERITGSLAFALPRMTLAAVINGSDDGPPRMLVRAKTSITSPGGGFGYDIEASEVAEGIEATEIIWGEPLKGTAKKLLADAEADEDDDAGSKLEKAEHLLESLLAKGERLQTEVMGYAAMNKISERTLRRAAENLGVVKRKEGFGGAGGLVVGLAVMNACSPSPSIR